MRDTYSSVSSMATPYTAMYEATNPSRPTRCSPYTTYTAMSSRRTTTSRINLGTAMRMLALEYVSNTPQYARNTMSGMSQ